MLWMVWRRSWWMSSWIRATIQELCGFWFSLCLSLSIDVRPVLNRACYWNTSARLKFWHALVPKGLLNHCEGLHATFPKIGTKFESRSDPSWKSPHVTYTTPNKHVWKLPTSTQLRATWHTDSLDMVVLPSTGASRYHSCCIDCGTSPENFGYHLVFLFSL